MSELYTVARSAALPGMVTLPENTDKNFSDWADAMSYGRFESAWQINDRSGGHWPSAHRLWNGEAVSGKTLIVRSMHGLGDAIQMLQYATQLQAACGSVIYEVQPPLRPLMAYFQGVDKAVSWTSAPWESEGWGVQTDMMELPHLFRTAVSALPLMTGYLQLPTSLRWDIAHRMGVKKSLRVGLVWSGGTWDPGRWIPFRLLGPLFADTRIEFWNLQEKSTAEDADGWPLKDVRPECGYDLLSYAAVISNLDLVITPDTLAAHLAGALGIPAWIMLKHEPDWRWMRHRTDTPWYPSARLFRQPFPGAWRDVIAAIKDALDWLPRAQLNRNYRRTPLRESAFVHASSKRTMTERR